MDKGSDAESHRPEGHTVTLEDCRHLCEMTGGDIDDTLVHQEQATEENAQRQADEGKSVDSIRTSLSNFRQSASRTTGQIRELLETAKAMDRDLVGFVQDPKTRAFLDCNDDDDDDNNLIEMGDDASSENPKEIEALKQKTKSLKRKLRKWRKAARMALSEICPDISSDAQGDMTPGTMKNVLQKIRQLKSLTERQTSIILNLTSQCETQKSESDEKDALIMELLRNCNGIRPALAKQEPQVQKNGQGPSASTPAFPSAIGSTGSGVGHLEGMVTKREAIDYPLVTASDVEEVLNQTGIQFGSAHLIPNHIHREAASAHGIEVNSAPRITICPGMDHGEHSGVDAKSGADNDVSFSMRPPPMQSLRQATTNKTGNVFWGLAFGATAAVGSMILGNLQKRQSDD